VTTQLGTYLAESGRGAEAIRLLEPVAAAAAGGTPDVDTLNALGIAYARAGRAEDARLIFDQILMLDPESVLAHENLGALDLAAARNEAAERHFETAVRLDPDASQAHAGLGVVAMRRGDREAAIAAWTKAVRLDATNYDALYNLATTLARAGRMEAARPYLEQFVRTAPPAFYARDIEAVRRVLQQRP